MTIHLCFQARISDWLHTQTVRHNLWGKTRTSHCMLSVAGLWSKMHAGVSGCAVSTLLHSPSTAATTTVGLGTIPSRSTLSLSTKRLPTQKWLLQLLKENAARGMVRTLTSSHDPRGYALLRSKAEITSVYEQLWLVPFKH